MREKRAAYTKAELFDRIAGLLAEEKVGNRQKLAATLAARAKTASLHMGNGLILPHPTESGRKLVVQELVLVQWFEKPIKYEKRDVRFAITLALKGDGHVEALQKIAEIFSDSAQIDAAVAAKDEAAIRRLLGV